MTTFCVEMLMKVMVSPWSIVTPNDSGTAQNPSVQPKTLRAPASLRLCVKQLKSASICVICGQKTVG